MSENTNQNKSLDLAHNTLGLEPFVVGFNIHGSDITEFVQIYLEKKGIHNAIAHIEAINEGTVAPKLGLVVTFQKSNAEIISNMGGGMGQEDILPVFAQRVQTGGLRASDKLRNAIAPLLIEKKSKVYRAEKNKNYVYIPICPIKTIAALLAVNPQLAKINITGVHTTKGEVVVTVFKQRKKAYINPSQAAAIYDDSMNRHFQ